MSIQELTNYFLQYGAFFIYLIVLLEYLNLPGFPAGFCNVSSLEVQRLERIFHET